MHMIRGVGWLVCVVVFVGCKLTNAQFPKVASCLRYDEIQQRFIHNAFGSIPDPVDEQLLDMLVFHRIRAFELDLQPSGSCPGGEVTATPDWFIYHGCGDFKTNVTKLTDALRLLRAFHNAQPRHEVVTLNLELGSSVPLKGGRSEFSTYSADQLDQLLRDELGVNTLFMPAHLLALRPGATTLAGAVAPDAAGRSGWPSTDDLRGRFIVVIHGHGTDLEDYFGKDSDEVQQRTQKAQQRAAFLIDESHWSQLPASELIAKVPFAVFHSEVPTKDKAGELRKALPGHILRSRQIDDCNQQDCRGDTNRARVAEAQAVGMNLLYMNMGSASDPAFRTWNEQRYPFGAAVPRSDGTFPTGDASWQQVSVIGKREPGSTLILGDSSGGDLDHGSDTFTFDVLPAADGVNETWITEIASTSNATVHPLGKGMLMARASLAANAAYCAVGRAADRYGLRMQWRSSDGAGTGFQEQFGDYATNRPVDRENWHFVQLTVDRVNGDRDSRCQMSISKNGKDWEPFGEARVFQNIALSSIGVATSSNSGFNADNARSYSGENQFFFVGLRRRAAGGTMAEVNLAALVRSGIGGSSAPFELRLQGPEEGCAAPRDVSRPAGPPPR